MSVTTIHRMAEGILESLTIQDVLEAINKNFGETTALQIKRNDGSFFKLSYVGLGRKAVDISSALIKFGLKKGDRIAVLSESRPEWAAVFFAAVSCGGILVPLDVKLSRKELEFILQDSGARFFFVSAEYSGAIEDVVRSCPGIEKIVSFDVLQDSRVVFMKDFALTEGEQKYNPIHPDDAALIVYTSGTTGVAKGVVLSYRNLLFEVIQLNKFIRFSRNDRFLSILPLNHMLEITGGLIAPLYAGATITYGDSIKPANILKLMKETGTTAMLCVPLILKMFHEGILKKVRKGPALEQKVFFGLLRFSRFLLRFNIRVGKKLFDRVHQEFGGEIRCFVSGGAPLDPRVEEDMTAMGFNVLQGYGLTETAPVITVNTFRERKFGSVGIPLESVEIKIVPGSDSNPHEGEIIARGPNIMLGYYHQPEKTAEVLQEGWFHTGDIGRMDRDGFLYITGRMKTMIVLGAGKKVFPEEIEAVLSKSALIREICVLGRQAVSGLKAGTEEVCAVVVPNLDQFPEEEKKDRAKIKERIGREIGRLSEDLAEYKRIADFQLYFDELPKTSTRKLKRNLIKDIASDVLPQKE